MEPILVAIIGVGGVLARHGCVGALSNHPLRHGADVHGGILLSQFPQRLLNGATYDVFSTVRRTTRMTNPDDAEITRSNDARFRDQSNPPIHKS